MNTAPNILPTELLIALVIVAIVGILIMLFAKKPKTQSIVFLFLTLFALLITFLSKSMIPDSYILQQVLAGIWGALAIFAFILRFIIQNHFRFAKVLLLASVIVGIIDIFI